MAATKKVIFETLQNLKSDDFTEFTWHLENPTDRIEPIPEARLENANRQTVANLMVQQYTDEAVNIAVKVLRDMKQNDLASKLERKLQEVQQPDQVDGSNAPVSVRQLQPIQSNWKRPDRIIPCTQSKEKILRENRDDVYKKNKSQRKGLALLITNTHKRDGAERDEENMEWLLKALGYRVEKHTNLSGKEIEDAVENFAALPDHKDSDSTFVVIMSHGNRIYNRDVIAGAGVSYTGPDDYFFVDKIFTRLNSVNCPALIDKPKVILIQACRGGDPGGVKMSDSTRGTYADDSSFDSDAWVHKEKDFACFMSTLPDTKAWRIESGSFFIMYIVEVFCKWAQDSHIMELFGKVTSGMAKHPGSKDIKFLPCIERTSLTKDFYLFPGL
ncbi:caspase b-like [Megalobrama amblycephala]|uniref:caspase b-like n=1 Tax=Megalobrama amblycephala TaxID=75352 RepID=UPI00201440E3|nr:caspase b-like [Megalobrama amblycephala]XP_048050920.1 caspase b-like [Megalobrama amblycephala]